MNNESFLFEVLQILPLMDSCKIFLKNIIIKIKMTSKKMKKVADKIKLPTAISINKKWFRSATNGTIAEKQNHIFNYIQSLTNISDIILSNCQIVTFNTNILCCQELVSLDLSNNRIGPDGAKSLELVFSQCKTLVNLNLSKNLIGANGAESIGKMIGQCQTLLYLNINSNKIGTNGIRSLSKVLKEFGQCKSLIYLNLSNNQIGSSGIKSLIIAFSILTIKHLDLSWNLIDSSGIEIIERYLYTNMYKTLSLKSLNLCNNQIEVYGIQSLTQVLQCCPFIDHLDLSFNEIRSDGLEKLSVFFGKCQCQKLEYLNISNNQISSIGIEHLSESLTQCSVLTHLNINNNQIGDRGAISLARVLEHCKSIVCLKLCNNHIGSIGSEIIKKVYKGFKILKL